jgi:CheY-like chemotaxis protein
MKPNHHTSMNDAHELLEEINILLADDDKGDCMLFKEALEELPLNTHLSLVHDGEELLKVITQVGSKLPDVLFLDLNMPRKNGFATLGEIKRTAGIQDLPVIIYSTASDRETVKKVYWDAAYYYIAKPTDFHKLKKVIYEALMLITSKDRCLPTVDKFQITGDSIIIPENT